MKVKPTGHPAWARMAKIGHYGGSQSKLDSSTEGTTPYAWTFYREFRDNLRGSAYTNASDTVIHVENLALSRFFGGVLRAAGALERNSTPGTASSSLEAWIELLGVRVLREDSYEDIRDLCKAKYGLLVGVGTGITNDASLRTAFEDFYVATHRTIGSDLDNPPDGTFWPVINPGSIEYDLGGGQWSSPRSRVIVEVSPPNESELGDFLDKVQTKLELHLDIICPAWITWDWSVGVESGFRLDIDQMDFVGMGA